MTRRTLEDAKPVDRRGKMCSVSPRHRMFDGSSLESFMAFLTEVVVGPAWACLAFEVLANDRLHSAVVTAVPDMNQFRCALEFYHWSLRSAVLTLGLWESPWESPISCVVNARKLGNLSGPTRYVEIGWPDF